MKKILFTLFLILTLTSVFSIFAFASEANSSDAGGFNDVFSDAEIDSEEIDTGSGENIFEAIYTAFSAYASEILSLLSLIGSLIVAFAYKRGLVPTLSGSLGSLNGAVEKLSIESRERAERDSGALNEAARLFSLVEERLRPICTSLNTLREEIASAKEEKAERESTRRVMLEQINMLYDVFMSSSLPQYQKEAIGERVGAMKRELCAGVAENEEEC